MNKIIKKMHEVKTRKHHWCFACTRYFESGTIMDTGTFEYEGETYDVYVCQDCIKIVNKYKDEMIDTCDGSLEEECVLEFINKKGYSLDNINMFIEKEISQEETCQEK